MNPNAASFSFNAGAADWTPGGFSAPPPAAPPAPPPPPAAPPAPGPEESDPLWVAVLKCAGGDRAEAKRLLGSPDELLKEASLWPLMKLDSFGLGAMAAAIDEAERWDDVVKPVVVRGYGSSCEADETCAAAPGLDACVAGAGEERSLGSPGWRSASRYDVRDEVHVQKAGQTRVVVAPPTRGVAARSAHHTH